MKKRRKGRKSALTLIREVDSVKVCKAGTEKVFMLPKAMTGEDYTSFKIDNRNYLRKLKNKKS